MKKINHFLLIALFISVSMTAAQAQTKKSSSDNKDPEEDKIDWSERLWFGTGFGGLGLTQTQFSLGVSPIVGYKFTGDLSAGLRLPLQYDYIKVQSSSGDVFSSQDLDWGLGAFVRQKLFWSIFAHAEYNTLFMRDPVVSGGFLQLDPNDPSKILKTSYRAKECNVGLGYSRSNGGLGYELSLLYNVLESSTNPLIPFSFRAGVNYNF